jgi:hypothetical protein
MRMLWEFNNNWGRGEWYNSKANDLDEYEPTLACGAHVILVAPHRTAISFKG